MPPNKGSKLANAAKPRGAGAVDTYLASVPADSVVLRTTPLGPVAVWPFDRPSNSELHFENESCAVAVPGPTVTA